MGKMRIEQQNGKNYLVGTIESTEQIDEDCLAAASEEETSDGKHGIPGVIPIICSQMFQEKLLRYDINAYTPVEEYKKKITNRNQLAELFLSIIDTYEQTEAYLLDVSYFLLEEQYIFVDEVGKAQLILYPVLVEEKEVDFRALFSQLMRGVRLVDSDMDFFGKIIYELTYTESFNLVKFKELLQERASKSVHIQKQENLQNIHQDRVQQLKVVESRQIQTIKPIEAESPFVQANPINEEEPPVISGRGTEKKTFGGLFKEAFGSGSKKESTKPKKEKAEKKNAKKTKGIALPDAEEVPEAHRENAAPLKENMQKFCGTDSVMGSYGASGPAAIPMTSDDDLPEYGSTDDEMEGMKYLTLFYENEKRQIPVQRLPFEIGREGNGLRVDSSKTKVSRKHVVISMSAEGFSVCDTSKLGTYMDGKKLPKDVFVPLNNGAVLDLKGEIFRVNIQ